MTEREYVEFLRERASIYVCFGPVTTHMPTEEFDAARRMFDEACVGVGFLGEYSEQH